MSRINIQSSRGTVDLRPVMGRKGPPGPTGPGADITGAELDAARDAAVDAAAAAEAHRDDVLAVVATNDGIMAAVDLDDASDFRLQQDARLAASIGVDDNPIGIAAGAAFARRVDLISLLDAPFYIAHRGGASVWPEHSMEGYRAAAQSGFMIEADVQPLADGTLVCCHDTTVNRTMVNADGTAAAGNVSSFTRAQWLAMRIKPAIAGGNTATPVFFNQLLDELGGRAPIVAEAKNASQPVTDAILAAIRSRGLDQSFVAASFSLSQVSALAAEGIHTQFIENSGVEGNIADMVAAGIDHYAPASNLSTSHYADAVAAGLRVTPYTVNNRNVFVPMSAVGVQGVYSDDPWLLTQRYPQKFRNTWSDTTRAEYGNNVRPGSGATGYDSFSLARPNGLKASPGIVSGGQAYRRLGEFKDLTGDVRVTATVKYLAPALDQNRAMLLALGTRTDDKALNNGSSDSAGQHMYFWYLRRGGGSTALTHYRADPDLNPVSIGTATCAEIAPPGGTGRVQVVFEITAASITTTVYSLDPLSGARSASPIGTLTTADTTWRGAMNIHVGANGMHGVFEDVWWESI